jgi:hypothetical protein
LHIFTLPGLGTYGRDRPYLSLIIRSEDDGSMSTRPQS